MDTYILTLITTIAWLTIWNVPEYTYFSKLILTLITGLFSLQIYTYSRLREQIPKPREESFKNYLGSREESLNYDMGFISELIKKTLETGDISLKKDTYKKYLQYGYFYLSDLNKSIIEKNNRNARFDAASAATHYLRAYFVRRYNKLSFSNETMMTWIKEENREIAMLYEKIMKGDYDMDLVEKIRDWVIENIDATKDDE